MLFCTCCFCTCFFLYQQKIVTLFFYIFFLKCKCDFVGCFYTATMLCTFFVKNKKYKHQFLYTICFVQKTTFVQKHFFVQKYVFVQTFFFCTRSSPRGFRGIPPNKKFQEHVTKQLHSKVRL